MHYVAPLRKLVAAQLPAALKVYGTDCMLYKKLESEQDEVYGIYGGSEPVVEVTTGTLPDVYGSYSSIPTEPSTGVVELPDLAVVSTTVIDISADYSPPTPVRVLLTPYQWRIINDSDSGFYEDSGYVYATSDIEIGAGDVLEVETEDGSTFRMIVISPEVFGKEKNILYRFKLSNLGG
jgi:hypothetical protein